ncbi:hypothetical protein SGRA_3675 [Saprospira grandis str. Lewin]|uniref:Uncharacterized protein n=1 Tax=Saprospira grandis (strain Lewin) TaxID=984262 RepID=H6L6W6_SAPGL|nr:hypothetical protein SGRA_3675 [Saprospira grandis str. Lewin]
MLPGCRFQPTDHRSFFTEEKILLFLTPLLIESRYLKVFFLGAKFFPFSSKQGL